jgi:hypothetical protein
LDRGPGGSRCNGQVVNQRKRSYGRLCCEPCGEVLDAPIPHRGTEDLGQYGTRDSGVGIGEFCSALCNVCEQRFRGVAKPLQGIDERPDRISGMLVMGAPRGSEAVARFVNFLARAVIGKSTGLAHDFPMQALRLQAERTQAAFEIQRRI